MSLACPVHQAPLLAMKRMLAGACRNVLVVVASWFVDYSLRSGDRHVLVPTYLRPSGPADCTGMYHSCRRRKLHLVEEMRSYDSYNIANVVDSMYVAVVGCIRVYICVYCHTLTYVWHYVG